MNLINSSGNWLLILTLVIQAIETEFTTFNLQNTFITEIPPELPFQLLSNPYVTTIN